MGAAVLFTRSYECNFSELKMKIAAVLIYKPTGWEWKKEENICLRKWEKDREEQKRGKNAWGLMERWKLSALYTSPISLSQAR